MATLTTTFNTAGTAARAGSIGGTEGWGTTANAKTSNDSRAAYSTNAVHPWNGYTLYLKLTDLVDKVPTGATIDGIKVTIERRASAGSPSETWKDSAVYLVVGGTIQTTQNKATATAYTTSDVSEDHGGAADLWGITLTAADVNASDFGVVLSCAASGGDGESFSTVEVDYIGVTINYTEAPTAQQSQLLLGVGPQ